MLAVAISDPENVLLLDNLKLLTGHEIQPFISTKTQIIKAIDEFYLRRRASSRRPLNAETQRREAEEMSRRSTPRRARLNLDQVIAGAQGAQASSLVNAILKQAIQERARTSISRSYDERVCAPLPHRRRALRAA